MAGAPSKFDRCEVAILKSLCYGASRSASAEAAGIHRSTFGNWFKDPARSDFALAVIAAEGKAELHYSKSLHDSAAGGKLIEDVTVEKFDLATGKVKERKTVKKWSAPMPGSSEFWLERRRRTDYRRRDDLTIDGGITVERIQRTIVKAT